MKKPQVIYHLARADFLERTRRYSFLITLGLVIYLGYIVNVGQLRLRLDQYHGELNSAWIGGVMATITLFFLTLFGFFLIRDTIARDEHTGVGQIIAATPISKFRYITGKVISNFIFLTIPVVILIAAAVTMQYLNSSGQDIEIAVLAAPFLGIVLPSLLMTSVLAVLVETVSWLRGALGAVTYFFTWTATVTLVFLGAQPIADWTGISVLWQSMAGAAREKFPDYQDGFMITFSPPTGMQTFQWTGINWTPEIISVRVFWIAVSFVLILLAAFLFNRFDPSLRKIKQSKHGKSKMVDSNEVESGLDAQPDRPIRLSPLKNSISSHAFGRTLVAELRLLMKGQRWWWYAIMGIIILGGFFSGMTEARSIWLPAAWIWPLMIWSTLGTRETQNHTGQIIFSSPRPLIRQLPATYLAGILVTALAGIGVFLNLIFAGAWSELFAWFAAVLFIPSLALLLGTFSGSSKLFEVIYFLLWYIGPIQAQASPKFDFMGAGEASIAAGMPLYFACFGLGFVLLAAVQRWRQIQA